MPKVGLGKSVLQAAEERISLIFDRFPRIYLSFSGGKDSSVMMHLVMAEAKRRDRKIGVLFVDLEAQYKLTIDHVEEMFARYEQWIDPHWVALPIHLRNAVSVYEPHWIAWQPDRRQDWVRQPSPRSVTDMTAYPFTTYGMEFEEFVPAFGHWYGQGQPCACFVGIRSDESLNRYRSINGSGWKSSLDGLAWTTWMSNSLYNAYPIYDWSVEDIWTYHGKTGLPCNQLYNRMHQAGLTLSQMRICQPYGDDQRRGLWLFHLIEPETWARVVARVNGANGGALYVQESGNMTGYRSISKPDGHTWESFAKLLLASMPEQTRIHYANKIAVFIKWWEDRGYPNGIPDDGPTDKGEPNWRRICKALLRNDYWCKGLSFTQTKSTAYERYRKLMDKRRLKWRTFLF